MMSATKCISVEEELQKNTELKLSDIQILKEWCEKQPHLPKIEDVQFAIFLHCNYYRIEPTKSTIENYYTLRTHLPEFFSNRDLLKMKNLRDASKVTAYVYLDGKTAEGYDIVFSRLIDLDYLHFIQDDSIKIAMMVLDEFVWTRGSTSEMVYVADCAGLTMAFMQRINPISLKKFIYYVQEALLVRLKAIHLINVSPVIQILVNIIKTLMKQELINMMYFHSTMDSAGKYLPIEALPNEVGGEAGAITELQAAHIKKIENFREWFLEDERVNRVNESLRIGESKASSDLFGMEGSFKKLDID